MFNELGSAVVQNVKFRDAWAFVGQKGIQGFTDIEQVRRDTGARWRRLSRVGKEGRTSDSGFLPLVDSETWPKCTLHRLNLATLSAYIFVVSNSLCLESVVEQTHLQDCVN